MAYDLNATTAYIRDAARRRGIDPDIAVRVARSEGLARGTWQSNLSKGGRREPSYGPFQFLVGGEGTGYPTGMGNDFKRDTGLDPSDPRNVNATIDYAMDRASKDGWSAWYGAAKVGVGRRDGIGGAKPVGPGAAPLQQVVAERQMAGGSGASQVVGGAGGDTLSGAPPMDVSLPSLRESKAADAMMKAGYSLGSNARNGWDAAGGLAQVLAGNMMSNRAETAEASALQKIMAGRDPQYQAIAQLVGGREGAAQAIIAEQENRTATARRQEDQAWRQDERTYQREQDEKANARADATLQLAQDKAAGKGAEGPKTSLSPVYGTDEAGNAVLLQPRDDGTVVQSKLPDGVKVSTGVDKIDAGTHWVLQDKRSGQVVGQVPKENFQEAADTARGTVVGKTEGERGLSAAGDAQSAQNALDLIGNIRDDPYRERGTGASSIMNRIPGTGGFDFQQKVEQAKSGAFLTAIQQMKGLGALSNTEGQAATAAITRMNTSASEEGFLEALADYEKIVRQALDRAQANMPKAATPAPAAPPAPPKGPMELPQKPAGPPPGWEEEWPLMTPEEKAKVLGNG